MTGNRYIDVLYKFPDRDTSINQLLEILKNMDKDFIDSINNEIPNIEDLNKEELNFLIIVSSLVDYFLQIRGMVVPKWLRDSKLAFDEPYYYQKRISDFEKVRLMYTAPNPFRNRNIYFDLHALIRV